MTKIGYTLSSEEHGPNDLVRYARRAEESGFDFAMISDHYHPWIDEQGQSPFVWSVLGGIAQATQIIQIGTGVTCPIRRVHPAIVAQAAATAAAMLPGRFVFGVGTGENLNEHIVGEHWPEPEVRQEMLREAIEIIRLLWDGGYTSYHGAYFLVENARLYTLPEELPPIVIAASGPDSATLAGQVGDGLVTTSPQKSLVHAFEHAGGNGKPRYGQLTVCWAEDETAARRTAHRVWPLSAIGGELHQELRLPLHFEQAARLVRTDDVAKLIPCGPDPERHLNAIRQYIDAGFDHVYMHQVGHDQEGFFRFYEREILPKLRSPVKTAGTPGR